MINKIKKFLRRKDIRIEEINNKIDLMEENIEKLLFSIDEIGKEKQGLEEKIKILEEDRSELFRRIDEYNIGMDNVRKESQDFGEKIKILEEDRSELFRRIDKYNIDMDKVGKESQDFGEKIKILEEDRNELFKRIDKYSVTIDEIGKENRNFDGKIQVLEKDRDEIFKRIDNNKKVLRNCGLLNVNARIDSRITRLEILQYYLDNSKYNCIDDEQKQMIEYLKKDYDYELSTGRTFYEDEYYIENIVEEKEELKMYCQDGLWYNYIDNKKMFWGENENDAYEYYKETIYWLEGDTPHRYVDPEKDGIDIPENSILLDIGAAEGYFGLKYIDRCKKVYFFECDDRWIRYLEATTKDFAEKIEIIKAYVGDKPGNIMIDEFFKDKEKPTVIKMDIEGAEGAVLRSMPNLINDDSLPLTMFICTYHRQDDWDRYYDILKGHFYISSSNGYYWNMQDPKPPFFRRGIMRAQRKGNR